MKNLFLRATLCSFLALASCAPNIYVQDRHTILEDEAAGEWPDFEKDLVTKSKESGPTAFQKLPANEKKKRLYNVLNGELVSEAETAKGAQ